MGKVLSIVIPVYNESRTIIRILEKVVNVQLINGIEKEVLIVNDYSTDETETIVLDFLKLHPHLPIRYLKHERNLGKGAAVHTGIREASGDYVIVQDADLEYDPEDFNLLLKPAEDGFADVVYGSRFSGGNPHRILFFWHTLGNQFLTFLSNLFTNLNLTDMETCYKLFSSPIIKSIHLKEKRFGFEPEVTAKIARIRGVRIYEVGISYYGRTYAEGKKITWRDGIMALFYIFKYNVLYRQ
ncbi:MAG: glycosyltransferase family 2 protein [Bacteroidetes bacterium]|nr:glycosyltransferase family 2 protein [Bacteroidota bacterium]